MNLIESKKKRTYDAIVIGSGASGGWAAKELCDRGLKTLVLERGRDVQHPKDYPTASKAPWEFEFRGNVPLKLRANHTNLRRYNAETFHWAMEDDEQPIIQEKPFRWFRGYHVGGKSLLWARQTQRWSDLDFEGPARDGFAIDWPIRYKDLAPWYDHVERFAGIAGDNDNLPELPDSICQPAFDASCIEKYFKESIRKNYGEERVVISARCAHLTDPQPIHYEQGRTKCMHQNMCNRGCIYGGYFSSNASTLPWAMKTGNMTLRPDAIVHSIIYKDKKKSRQKASGVRIIDRHSGEMIEFYAKLIFVNASTINSNAILLNSRSSRFPDGLGNDNGLLGKYLSWHNYRGKASAVYEGLTDKKTEGRSPSYSYIPRFRNLYQQETDFLRGYAIGVAGGRGYSVDTAPMGDELRNNILHPELGPWRLSTWMMGECVPVEENHIRLSGDQKDKYGIPKIILSCEWQDNDEKMVKDYIDQSVEMFEKAGFVDINAHDTQSPPGSDIHEMGGVRMGRDPGDSILNEWNQVHACKNVFVTDGACMTSTGSQNPTLTFMAITARAANYAVDELNRRNL